AGLMLINGWLDLTCSGASVTANARHDVGLRRSWLVDAADTYAAGQDPSHPQGSPGGAGLSRLPPIHLQAGSLDLLLSDSEAFAERARAAGVKVSFRRFDGMWHDFQMAAGQSHDADDAVRDIGDVIRGFWGEPESARAAVAAQPSTRAE